VPFICSNNPLCVWDKSSLITQLALLNKKLNDSQQNPYPELRQVFGSFTHSDGYYIVSEINNLSANYHPDKIQAGFFKLCSDVTDIFNTGFDNIGVFVYNYDESLKSGNMYLASYAYTYRDTNSPTYIQGKRVNQPSVINPNITNTFSSSIQVDLKTTTSIYYPSNLYSSGSGPDIECVAAINHTNEPGVYLIGNPRMMGKLGLCTPPPTEESCSDLSPSSKSDGNYFNQLIGSCICKRCANSKDCRSSQAPNNEMSQINLGIHGFDGWWAKGTGCPPTCVWESCYDKQNPCDDSDTSDNWSKWDVRPSGCKPMHLACLGRGTQKRYRHLKNVVWDYPSPSNLTCNILGSDTTISGTQGEPGPSLPPILPADTLDKDLSNYIPYLGYWKEDGTYVPNPDIYDTDTRPCGVSISVCGTGHQGGENLSSPGASCKKAGLYWNVAPFIPLGPGPSGIIGQPGPFCSMCHSGATSTGSDYDKNLENRKNVPEYNKSGASSNLSSVKSGSCWCDATWCHTNLDQGPGTDDVNPNGCFTASDPSGNMGKLGSSQSACWAYWACPGAGCEHLQQCASTTCDQGTCRVNEVGSGEVTWFKCGPNQLNVYCTADSDCPGSYCANKPPKKPPYQCFSGSKTYPNCVIVPNPNKSSPGAYKGDGVGGYYTIYGGPSSPGYDYGVYNSPTDDNQGTKNCNEYGMGAPWIPV